MIKKLTKHGNSWALVIDKAIMEILHIEPNSPLEVETDGKALLIAPLTDRHRRKKFENALKQTNQRYSKALKKLAQ